MLAVLALVNVAPLTAATGTGSINNCCRTMETGRLRDIAPLIVMVVEDEALIRLDVVMELEGAGFEVVDAADGDEALAVLQSRNDVAALFTDVNMPGGLDGIQLAYRARDLHPNIRVIVTSGVGRVDETALPPGGRFVPKPYACTHVAALLAA